MANIYQDYIFKKIKSMNIYCEKKDDLLILKSKNNHITYIQFDIDKNRPQDIKFFTSPLETLKNRDDYKEYFELAKAASLFNEVNIFRWYITEYGDFIGTYYETLSPKSCLKEVVNILFRLQSALSIWDSVKAKRQST